MDRRTLLLSIAIASLPVAVRADQTTADRMRLEALRDELMSYNTSTQTVMTDRKYWALSNEYDEVMKRLNKVRPQSPPFAPPKTLPANSSLLAPPMPKLTEEQSRRAYEESQKVGTPIQREWLRNNKR